MFFDFQQLSVMSQNESVVSAIFNANQSISSNVSNTSIAPTETISRDEFERQLCETFMLLKSEVPEEKQEVSENSILQLLDTFQKYR